MPAPNGNKTKRKENNNMNRITTKDGTEIYFKDWGTGPVETFSHGFASNARSETGLLATEL